MVRLAHSAKQTTLAQFGSIDLARKSPAPSSAGLQPHWPGHFGALARSIGAGIVMNERMEQASNF
jgi:hypothetical protein